MFGLRFNKIVFMEQMCVVCVLLSLKNGRKRHRQTVSNGLQCLECGKGFSTSAGLRLHNQYHTGKFSYYCGQCRRGFTKKSHYNEHMRKHEGRGYPYEYCPKLFKDAKNLRYHLSEHTGRFRFTCDTCGKQYNIQNLHVKHLESHRSQWNYFL